MITHHPKKLKERDKKKLRLNNIFNNNKKKIKKNQNLNYR
jgi:hypothetical protein